jgi:hypothetical protein
MLRHTRSFNAPAWHECMFNMADAAMAWDHQHGRFMDPWWWRVFNICMCHSWR